VSEKLALSRSLVSGLPRLFFSFFFSLSLSPPPFSRWNNPAHATEIAGGERARFARAASTAFEDARSVRRPSVDSRVVEEVTVTTRVPK